MVHAGGRERGMRPVVHGPGGRARAAAAPVAARPVLGVQVVVVQADRRGRLCTPALLSEAWEAPGSPCGCTPVQAW